ncbi:NtaA/DmoA family FMN-dependent monooxygenase [Chitinasiproducens palmae]|uniref:FMN-dependent oxidoreductase, nitrilotriacetate monooxygenase family n=1 Tax=Chitinasiproducens palmae TaxID=1770053 RepID=A0A1H2PPX8_9BURK|nr:NtaA/DmoA family FMN-dependent monooxygenase [Chitinasiproducens palmae]SDV48863.1 FMN-dependent oxidoreductase, nitrilotriacetate monooxygenase family [Chitinasiproducens palmae]
MSGKERKLHLGFTVWPTGFHPAGWRLPGAKSDGNSDARFLRELAQQAEAAKFDFFFIGDQVVGLPEWQFERPNQVLRPEALTYAGFVAAATRRIGIVATVNVTYADPYSVARATATLDHLSEGRLGWNVVTGEAEAAAANYGRKEHWDNEKRYDWASEFTEAVKLLWDSWEDDAKIADRERGVLFDSDKVHRIDYRGEFFSIDGPLNVERPVQGQIPIVNAGRSDRSIEFGSKYSDIKFTNSTALGLAGAQTYYADLKARAAAQGRDPDKQFIIPGLIVYVERTQEAAHRRYREIQDLTLVDSDLQALGDALGVDLSGLPDTTEVDDVEALRGLVGKPASIVADARTNAGPGSFTLRRLFLSFHRRWYFREIVGDPTTIADIIQHWFESRAADGFMIFPPYVPGGAEAFFQLVVPELQQRGLFRTEYDGTTLRDHFGLDKPANVFAAARSHAAAAVAPADAALAQSA